MSTKEAPKGMELLKEVAHVSGKSGLFRVLKPSRSGVILETLDAKREKTMVGPTARVSVLKDVSVFTEGEQESVPLAEVFQAIRSQHGEQVALVPKTATDQELVSFLVEILPDYDRDKVYVSDIKKIISWYNVLSTYLPEVFEATEEAEENTSEG
jgi:hypothetical protein